MILLAWSSHLNWAILTTLGTLIPVLLRVAFLTLAERKVMGRIHRRKGPDVVGVAGILQPFSDALKLLRKTPAIPASANAWIFLFAPAWRLVTALIVWAVIPLGEGLIVVDLTLRFFFVLTVSSLAVYGILLAGWASNSMYAFLGRLRSAGQMVSYEVSLRLILLSVVLCAGSFNLEDLILGQWRIFFLIPLRPVFILFFISGLAETNRAPFDLPEAEAELVAGYNVEYASMGFALFFLGEYVHMIIMRLLTISFFGGGWLRPITLLNWIPGGVWGGIKTSLFLFIFIWIRATFPRYRYDQLMCLGWKIFLPLALGCFMFVGGAVARFGGTSLG